MFFAYEFEKSAVLAKRTFTRNFKRYKWCKREEVILKTFKIELLHVEKFSRISICLHLIADIRMAKLIHLCQNKFSYFHLFLIFLWLKKKSLINDKNQDYFKVVKVEHNAKFCGQK